MAAKPTHGTEIFVDDRDELAEVRWATLAEADQLMQPYGMFGPYCQLMSDRDIRAYEISPGSNPVLLTDAGILPGKITLKAGAQRHPSGRERRERP